MPSKEKETKLCKYCQTEIPKKAKICHNCRKKQGKNRKWIIIVAITFLIVGAATSRGKENKEPQKIEEFANTVGEDKKDTTDSIETNEKETLFKVGEIAELNGVQVKLTEYKEIEGSEYNKPTDGNIFLLAEFEIANNSNSEIEISSILNFEAYADDYALNYSLSAMVENNENQLDGSIAAGKKLKGWIGWEVPSDWKKIEIHFSDNAWSINKFKFEITK